MTNKTKNIIITIIIPLFLITFMIINLVKEDDSLSLSERRPLAPFPELSLAKIFDGSFMSSFDKYATDQFYHRDDFRLLKANIDLTFQKNYHNLYTYEDYIIEQIYPLNINSINSLSKKINNIKDQYLDSTNQIYFSIVPDKNYYINNHNLKLDYQTLVSTLKNNLSYAKYIDIMSELSLKDYYKTDPHWREENLINVATTLTKNMNAYHSTSYNTTLLTTFKGTYSSRIPQKQEATDNLSILTNFTINNAKVYNYQTNTSTAIYDLSAMSSNDKYNIYLSGSVPLITIINPNPSNTKELIIFRDSFASSLAPLLLSSYSKITLIDTRYISPKILTNYIDFSNKDILFIYSTLLINDSVSIK